jgi:hypothetical protein
MQLNHHNAVPVIQMLDRDFGKAVTALHDSAAHLEALGGPETARVMHRLAEFILTGQIAISRAIASEMRSNAMTDRYFTFPFEIETQSLQSNQEHDRKEQTE